MPGVQDRQTANVDAYVTASAFAHVAARLRHLKHEAVVVGSDDVIAYVQMDFACERRWIAARFQSAREFIEAKVDQLLDLRKADTQRAG